MRIILRAALLALVPAALTAAITEPFDAGWRFLKADTPGAEQAGVTGE